MAATSAIAYYASMEALRRHHRPLHHKFSSFGTIIYLPETCEVDFGREVWPQPPNVKKSKCPRVLLVSTVTASSTSLS